VIWYTTDLARFQRERQLILELASKVDWLTLVKEYSDSELHLCWDVDIQIERRTFEVTLKYPSLFPSTPPQILPRDKQALWSRHQWGRGRELCTEFGSDNWNSEITGTDLIESAHRLLEAECRESSQPVDVPSRHQFTEGQNLRWAVLRLFLTESTKQRLAEIDLGKSCKAVVLSAVQTDALVFRVSSISEDSQWSDPEIPSHIPKEQFGRKAVIHRIDEASILPRADSGENFTTDLTSLGLSFDESESVVVILRQAEIHAYFIWPDKTVGSITIVEPEKNAARNPESHTALKSLSVGLVGCGSVGSKMATSLVRAGISKFVLVDDDILREGNLVRNDLDWREVGGHKANVLAKKLQLLRPGIEVTSKCFRLGGYESGLQTEAVLTALSVCDLLIDATSDGSAFNYLSTVATSEKKALLWAQVLAGGIGGIIARFRPGLEPDPQVIRAVIAQWFVGKGFPPPSKKVQYGLPREDGTLIADDADVSVIGGHATRLAIDTLLKRDPSLFPNSVYLIGLSNIGFKEPFHTIPIDLVNLPSPEQAPELPEEEAAKVRKEVIDLIVSGLNEAANKL
jgi:sulfur-carrier protein adenylyltransferase/sulfurtransferase